MPLFHRVFHRVPTARSRTAGLLLIAVVVAATPLTVLPTAAAEPLPLPGTKPLTEDGDLAAKMVQGLHRYLDRELAAAPKNRDQFGKTRADEPVGAKRERLRKLLGVVDPRLPPRMEYVGGPGDPARVAECDAYTVHAVRWVVLPGVDGEGLLIEPKGKVLANVVAIPDAAWTPERITGLTRDARGPASFANRLAEHGCRVVVPVLIDRGDTLSGNPRLSRATNIPHREFIHRMAYSMGRTLIGYEVQKVLAAVDWFVARGKDVPVGVMGVGEGGRLALYAAAVDERIGAAQVACAFGPREGMHDEPLDRNLWGVLREFGDAEVAALIHPRPFAIDPPPAVAAGKLDLPDGYWPEYRGPVGTAGRGGAAPGTIRPIPVADSTREWKRFQALTGAPRPPARATTGYGWRTLLGHLGGPAGEQHPDPPLADPPLTDLRKTFDPAARHKRQFEQLVAFTQKLWRDSEAVRKEFWKKSDASSPEAWERSCEPYREHFHTEVIGRLPEPTVPLNPRTRRVYDEPTFTGYEVVLDVYPDVFASGILLLPKGVRPGERRPVVVCQHGLEGTPRRTIDPEPRPVYGQFSRRLVELGYVVYAPQNPYYGGNEFRQLQRKANPLKLSLFSFIIRQHQRTLDWLETLPNVDAKRIAFYGLSYGGKTAMRVPAVEKRYALSICSGDFNEWIGKNVSVDLDRSYMWTGEYEMYEFDLGQTFNYAEMAYLIAPRPFMVERGHDDGVGTDEMVAYEYAKVRYLYANRLKLPERTAIEFFPGGHQIHARGTFAFLKKHLGFPE